MFFCSFTSSFDQFLAEIDNFKVFKFRFLRGEGYSTSYTQPIINIRDSFNSECLTL